MLLYPQPPVHPTFHHQNPYFPPNGHTNGAPNGAWPGSERYPKGPYNSGQYPTAPPSPPYYYPHPPAPQQPVFYPAPPNAQWPGTPTSEVPPQLPMQRQQQGQMPVDGQGNMQMQTGGVPSGYGDEENDVYIVLVGNVSISGWHEPWTLELTCVARVEGEVAGAEGSR